MRRVIFPVLAAGLALLLALLWSIPAAPPPFPGVNEPVLRVPVAAAIDGGSRRSVENVEDLFARAASIWAVCRIAPDLGGVAENATRNSPGTGIRAFFVPDLGANGIADAERLLIRVNDTTTVPPYRALAHELGHILGLFHTFESRDRLMFQGVNGTRLTPGECARARAVAGGLFPPGA